MKALYFTETFKKSIYALFAVWIIFLFYFAGYPLCTISFLVYLIQIIICANAFKKSFLSFTNNKAEEYGPSFSKNKRNIIILLLMLLVLDQFPLIVSSIYPSHPTSTGAYSDWDYSYGHSPSDAFILWDIIASIAIIIFIYKVLEEAKDPNELLAEHTERMEYLRQLEIRDQEAANRCEEENRKEENRKIALYGRDYVSSCAGVVFSKDKDKMWICELEYLPQEILSVEIDDISTTTQMSQEIKTKTSTGSMIGRGLVGGVLLGPAGAIIGGTTAKKNSIISEGEIITNYRYKLRIISSKIDHELISYESRNLDALRECQSLIMAFISRNRQNTLRGGIY